jgi:hypothetical protein
LTGDSFYQPSTSVTPSSTFVASHQRLVDFTRDKPVAHLRHAHRQTNTPFVDYREEPCPAGGRVSVTRGVLLNLNDT